MDVIIHPSCLNLYTGLHCNKQKFTHKRGGYIMWYATWHERFMKLGFIVDQHAVSSIDNTEGLMCHQNGPTYILTNHNYLQTYSQPSSESRQIHWAIHWCHWVTYMAESYMKDLADIKGNILTEHSLAQKTRRCYVSLNMFFFIIMNISSSYYLSALSSTIPVLVP